MTVTVMTGGHWDEDDGGDDLSGDEDDGGDDLSKW